MSFLRGLHRWIAAPPNGLEGEVRHSYAMAHYTCLIGLLSHLSWVGLFYALNESLLWQVNVVSVLFFVVALVVLRRGRVVQALVIASVEVLGHGCIATYQLGWDAQYQLYLLLLVFIWLLVRGLSMRQRALAIGSPVAVFAALYIGLESIIGYVAPSSMSPDTRALLARVNLVTCVMVVVGAYSYYVVAVAKAWRTGQDGTSDTLLDRVLDLGVLDVDEAERQRIRTINFVSTCALGLTAFYTISFTLLGWGYAALFNALVVVLYSFALLFSIAMLNRLSGVYLLSVGIVHLSVLPLLLLSPSAGIHYFLLVIPVFSVAVVRASDWQWVWRLTLAAFGMLGCIEWTAGSIASPWRADTSSVMDTGLRIASVTLTGLLIMLVAFLWNVDIEKAREKLATLNKLLARRLDKEQEVNRAKNKFIAQMSHELRTPLNGILGTCEALDEEVYGPLQQRQHDALGVIRTAGQHQLELVNDLLDLSKIEAGSFEPVYGRMSLVTLCTEVSQIMRAKAKQGGVRLSLSLDGDIDELVSDERRVRQIVLNLLGNALKFTPKGGRIGLDLIQQGAEVVIAVWDTGIGIPAGEIDRMFEAFTQLDSELSRRHAGSGLGLNLSAKLAAALSGRIEAESEEGKGSRFTLCLPLEGVGQAQVALPSEGLGPAAVIPTTGESDDGLRVLLVDDTPTNIGHLRDFLLQKGHRVTTAANGLEAIAEAQALPDIIFMDVQMPEMDGLEAIRRLRAEAHTRGLHIVALTSFAMGEDRDRCLEAGADDFETKPVSIRRVLELVEARGPTRERVGSELERGLASAGRGGDGE
jgi:signal transduction histidine kinase/AmiR/NasT family two-component response regulator